MTPYNKLYANLLPKFKSYEIPSMKVEEIEDMLHDYLIPAITRFHVCIKDLSNRNDEIRYTLTGLWVLVYISSIKFNLSYPFGCTMDFRYIVPVLFSTSIILGVTGNICENSGSVILKTFSALTDSLVILLAVASILAFI